MTRQQTKNHHIALFLYVVCLALSIYGEATGKAQQYQDLLACLFISASIYGAQA